MKLQVEIDAQKVLAAMLKAPQEFTDELRKAMKREMATVADRARLRHRFITRTGFLERSIQEEVSPAGFSGHVYLDDGIAPYGKHVHRGHGTWASDPFLTDAFKRRKFIIIRNLGKAMHRGLRKAGLV